MLSWWGPKARYFGRYSGPFDARFVFRNEIFQAGEVFALTPQPVLGAALTKDASGAEWLVAICQDGANEVVLRRPNKKSNSPDVYDPVFAPEGWQEIGRSNVSATLGVFVDPDVPWFFNGDGTEAQTVRRKLELTITGGQGVNRYVGSERLKINITGGSATLAPLGNLPGIKVISTCTNKLPVAGCQGDVFYNIGQTRRGQYVIAVDYIDSQEVRAVVSDSRNNSYDMSATTTSDDPVSCRVSTTNFSMHARESGQLALDVGGSSFILQQIVNDNSYVAVVVNTNGSRSGTNTEIISYAVEGRDLDSLDLRYGLIAGGQIKSTNNLSWTCSGPWGRFCPTPGTLTTTRDIARGVKSSIGNMDIFSTSSSDMQQYHRSQNFTIAVEPCNNVGETVEYPDPKNFVTSVPGSWLVDADNNLLVSQDYRDQTGVMRPFNYLTGGNLTQVVPVAPQDAVYFPAGVIR